MLEMLHYLGAALAFILLVLLAVFLVYLLYIVGIRLREKIGGRS